MSKPTASDDGRIERLVARVRSGLDRAFAQNHTPTEIAASFAFASAYAVLPTAGTALVLFVVLAAIADRVSRVALLAALVVFNPAVKWALYAASYPIGAALLGPAPGVSPADVTASISFTAARGVVLRQLLGNVVLAAIVAGGGGVLAYRLARRYADRTAGRDDVSESDSHRADDPDSR